MYKCVILIALGWISLHFRMYTFYKRKKYVFVQEILWKPKYYKINELMNTYNVEKLKKLSYEEKF